VVPWNHPLDATQFDGLFLSNGPGDPAMCSATVENVKKLLAAQAGTPQLKPIFGICLGHQLLSTAAGCRTYKMKCVLRLSVYCGINNLQTLKNEKGGKKITLSVFLGMATEDTTNLLPTMEQTGVS